MTDTERIDWLEKITHDGMCPGLIFDDNGHWAVAFDGMQTCAAGDEGQDIDTTFIVLAAEWCNSPRKAIDKARNDLEEGQ